VSQLGVEHAEGEPRSRYDIVPLLFWGNLGSYSSLVADLGFGDGIQRLDAILALDSLSCVLRVGECHVLMLGAS
jgi:hypothetical protein